MNQAIKERWVKALRSEEYKQGDAALHYEDTYCCLGVLCDLVDPNGWDCTNGADHVERSMTRHQGFDSMPSTQVLIEADLDDHNAHTLAGLNDEQGWSFEQIADWIEEKL